MPLLIDDSWLPLTGLTEEDLDNVIAMLEHSDRVCQIALAVKPGSQSEKVLRLMKEPFPELTHLTFSSDSKVVRSVLVPDLFLDGSAPRLRQLSMWKVSYPGLPNLLLSGTHLAELHLHDISHSMYISPEAMVIVLATFTGFESLLLDFQSPRSRPDQEGRRPHPSTRFVIPPRSQKN